MLFNGLPLVKSPVGMHKTGNSRYTAVKEKMELDWTHNTKKHNSNNKTGIDMEPTRQTG